MAATVLFESGNHRNILLDQSSAGEAAVQANQHLIIHEQGGMILDPGGHKVYSKVLAETFKQLGGGKLESIFLSHQDPDIVAALNGWLMTTDATAYSSSLWLRFIPHFGLDRLVTSRLVGLPDHGGTIDLHGLKLQIIPAHFLHSAGNLHVYDPVSKILYSGDLGASIDHGFEAVEDWDAHVPFMDGFHRRYMASGVALKRWVAIVRKLDVEVIAPQHGAFFKGKPMVEKFLAWCEQLETGLDRLDQLYGPA